MFYSSSLKSVPHRGNPSGAGHEAALAALHGQPLLCLPALAIEVVPIELSAQERERYAALHEQCHSTVERYAREGAAAGNYAHMLVCWGGLPALLDIAGQSPPIGLPNSSRFSCDIPFRAVFDQRDSFC